MADELEWEELPPNGFRAVRNEHTVGIVTRRHDGVVAWQITAVHTRFVCKGAGEARTMPKAKAMLAAAWKRWQEAYGLAPRPQSSEAMEGSDAV